VNGIRAIERKKALQDVIKKEIPDIIFIQEIKAQSEQLSEYLTQNGKYFQYYHSAQKKGYSGVGMWLLKKTFPEKHTILTGMPGWEDIEGRIIGLKFKQMIFLGIYFPNGGKSKEAWLEKLQFYDHFLAYINKLRSKKKKVIWTGDLNVAHQEIDLARPKENMKNIGFRPEERAWFDQVISSNWIDIFRTLHPEKISYTYWDVPSRARERNVGWRIDYFLIDKPLIKKINSAYHNNDDMGSDHCPIFLEIDL
jgi:exodeoxyribonuclease-3